MKSDHGPGLSTQFVAFNFNFLFSLSFKLVHAILKFLLCAGHAQKNGAVSEVDKEYI
jgi:hypothetical protein